jgi:tetratricopeptide (TPR) repeat protein
MSIVKKRFQNRRPEEAVKSYKMIRPLLIFIISFWGVIALPQAKTQTKAPTKAPTKEKAQSQTEMQGMLNEMQKAMDELSPEDKKMLESMGVKIPTMNNLPNASEMAVAFEEEGRVIPSKKSELIAQLPRKIFSIAELNTYLKTTNASVSAIITPKSKELAEKVMEQFHNDPYYGYMIASVANGMWMMGLKEPAVYLMGEATKVLPNSDNYNNYAAYLTMTGAGHMAIPIFQKLNSLYPQNSTVLNNLGQAWLQLGDEDKAGSYLDSAIMVYAYHPQANYTKCLILEEKGETAEAIVALKQSLKHSITRSKLDELKKLEKNPNQPSKYYVPRTYFSTSFNLGIYTALIPPTYSKTVGMNIQDQWQAFREQLSDEKAGLDAAIRMAKQKADQELQILQAKVKGSSQVVFSPYYLKALQVYANKYSGNSMEQDFTRQGEEGAKYLMDWAQYKGAFETELDKEKERYEMEAPNGTNLEPNCAREIPIINKYLIIINGLNENYREKNVRKWVIDAYNQYDNVTATAPTEGAALVEVLEIKRDFVRKLLELKHEYYDYPACLKEDEAKKAVRKKLPDYDKVNCKTASSLYVPLTGQIVIRCNEMDVIFNPTYLPVKSSWTENFNTNKIEEASIGVTIKAVDLTVSGKFEDDGTFKSGKVSIGKNIKGIDVSANGEFDASGFTKGSVDLGIDGSLSLLPKTITEAATVDISLKGKLGVGLELGPEGITDFYVKETTSLDMATTIKSDFDQTGDETTGLINEIAKGADIQLEAPKVGAGASISADNRVGVNSGYSGKSSSEFSGLRVK